MCKHAWAFFCTSMCWYVLLFFCMFYQSAKQGQARWTAGRIIYSFVFGIWLLSCSILIADASLRRCVWESSRDIIIMSQSNVKYKSIKKKIPLRLKFVSLSLWLTEWHGYETTEVSEMKYGPVDWLVENRKKCSHVRNTSQDWVISRVNVKADLKTSFLFWTLAAREWQNTLLLSSQHCRQRRCWTQTSTETMKCVHTWAYFYVCISVCISVCNSALCVCLKNRGEQEQLSLSVTSKWMCRWHWISFFYTLFFSPGLDDFLLFTTFCIMSACYCTVWQQRRRDSSVNVYCIRVC